MASIVECGIDWITCSGSLAVSGADVHRLMEFASRGEKRHDTQFMGFVGWRSGSFFYGEKATRWLVQCSGFEASNYWARLVAMAERVSRLDLQMTVHYEQGHAAIPAELYESAKRQRQIQGAYPKIQLITGDPTGDTCYIGDRTSDKFFRCYDKEAQSGEPEYAGCIRFELECKAGYALWMAASLLDSQTESKDICGAIQAYLHAHDLYPPLPPMVSFKLPPRARKGSGDEAKIAWLTKQVAPTVLALVDKGLIVAVVQALGLQGETGQIHP